MTVSCAVDQVQLTVMNTENDIPLCIGEDVMLEFPGKKYLPVKVFSMNGDLMGYLGINKHTTRFGTMGSIELFDLMQDYDLTNIHVKYHTDHSIQQVVLEAQVEPIQQLSLA